MRSADRTGTIGASVYWLQTWPRRYGFALITVAAATLLRYPLGQLIGHNLPFILFYPAVLLVAWIAGLGPGIFAVSLSAMSAIYLFFGSTGPSTFGLPNNANGLMLFMIAGVVISGLADVYRRRAQRLREFERAAAGVEEGIIVVDRHYRYVFANRVFLGYRGVKSEELVGHSLAETVGPSVFETSVKPKLDECFQGKVVKFAKRYTYPAIGERDFSASYYPIEGPTGIDRVACIFQDITEQKRAEHALRLFRTLIDQSNDAVEVIDPQTLRFLDVNEKACTDLGYTREEMLGLTVFDINPSVDESMREGVIERVRESGFILLQGIHKRKDGSTFPVEVSLRCVQLDRRYMVAITRDISDRKKIEDSLRNSEDRYRDLVEHSEDLVCTHDLEGNLLSANPAPARTLGYKVGELLKIPMRELVAPEFREQFDAYLARIKTNGADKGLLCVVTRNGERRIWEYNNTLRTEGVAVPTVRGMAHDITEQKRAEEALRDSEQRYRMLFEKTVAGVATISMEGQVIDCNDAWAHMFGYSDARACRGAEVGAHYFDLADRQALIAELKQSGAVTNRELQLRRRDGTPLWILVNDILLGDSQNRRIQATVVDITARKNAEAALRQREEDYRSFVAQSSEGIFRQDMDAPISIDLPEDELVQHILHDSYLAECNDSIARMYGLTVQDFIGKRLTETLDPNDPRNIELTREYVRSGFRVLERESHEVDIHSNPKVFRNSMIGIVENGMLLRTWGIQRDVTEQVKLEEARAGAEKALRKSEEHFRLLVEQASDGIFIADAQGRYVDVNSAGAEMFGYTREEIMKLSIADVLATEDSPRIAPEIARVVSGETVRSEWMYRRKDGSTFPGEVIGRLLPDGRLQGIVRDMTERKRAEEAMRRNEERFRVALKDTPITVFNQDRELRYTWIYNPQLYWQHEIIGMTDDEIIGAKKAGLLNELKRRVLETGTPLREEVVIPHDGKKYAIDITIEPLFDRESKIVGITGASMDIARLHELADSLQDARDRLEHEKLYLESEIEAELGFEEIIGQSAALRDVLKKARVVAPTDSTVLLLGETGTGKELVARAVHSLSSRRGRNFIKLNCAAVPSGLLESELFGHEKGAFTGAVNQKIGRLELADGGTLFLDEVGELPTELQPKLLRVLQDREFERLGGVHTLHIDVRIVSATNRELQKDVAEKRFREDLYYRLNVFPIQLPPLRERRSDIPMLVHHFVHKYGAQMGRRIETIPSETMAVLQSWSWPGNIRELENVIERMVIMTKDKELAPPPSELIGPQEFLDDNLRDMDREHIIRILRETNGVLSGPDGAASRLGIKRTTLQSMLKRFGIEVQEYRRGTGTLGRE